jgi:hypothetical protein
MGAAHLIALIAGALLAAATLLHVARTLVVPRARWSAPQRLVDVVVDIAFRALVWRIKDYEDRDSVLAAEGAAFLVVQLVSWLAALEVAFALMLWPYVAGGFSDALLEAASSLFSLGFAATRTAGPIVLDLLAAVTGLIVITVQIAYLPSLYAAFNRREMAVTLLEARAGVPPWGPEVLLRTRYGVVSRIDDLPELYSEWERWAADLAESHANYPVLVRFRSPQPLSSWLVGLLAVMDSAAMLLALSPGREKIESRLVIRMGFTALRQIGAAVGLPIESDPDPDSEIALTYDEFAAAVEQLVEIGFPVERSAEEAWPHFRGWRVNYESVAYALCHRTDQVPAPWSGPRRWTAETIAVRRPPNRAPGGRRQSPALKDREEVVQAP